MMANGSNEGIRHSFRVTTDAFAQGDNALVNHKTYYFMVLAYGYNNYQDYDPSQGSGQDVQFKASRKAAVGSLRVYSGVPHDPAPEAGGTTQYAEYGSGVPITRIEGKGNGRNLLDLTPESEAYILEHNIAEELTYAPGAGPIDVRVVDPLRVTAADFEFRMAPDDADLEDAVDAYWTLTNLTLLNDNDPTNDNKAVHESTKSIAVLNEELLLDWGLSVTVHQYAYEGNFTEPLESDIVFADPTRPWLQGFPDGEGFNPTNWIRSGNQEGDGDVEEEVVYNDYDTGSPIDEDEAYEGILGGTWAPYRLVSYTDPAVTLVTGETVAMPNVAPSLDGFDGYISPFNQLEGLNNVDVVLTSDKSKWTRCPVLEMQSNEILAAKQTGDEDGNDPQKLRLRRHYSVDKNGRAPGEAGYNAAEGNPGGQPIGMGWFPGYAIDLNTGERLNMAFGEDSWFSADNGDDMIWNPSSSMTYAGGQHWIYVFKNSRSEEGTDNRMPVYDGGDYLYQALETEGSTTTIRRVFRSCTWVGSALLNPDFELLPIEQGLIPNVVRINLRVAKAFEKYSPTVYDVTNTTGAQNHWNPLYTFSTRSVATETGVTAELTDGLDRINVVPNPYYAFSGYETSKLDNRVKITNLPEVCTVSIYNLHGTLVRQFLKADPLTSLDWDLKNERNVPIAGGVYIIHVDVPGVGEKILKWFGVMRPVDLDTF
jgi:hypothetical protein